MVNEADVRTALNQLLDDLTTISKGSIQSWLTKNSTNVQIVYNAKGPSITAELLGLNTGSLNNWRLHNRIPSNLIIRNQQSVLSEAPVVTDLDIWNKENDINYWRGKYEGIVEGLKLMRGNSHDTGD